MSGGYPVSAKGCVLALEPYYGGSHRAVLDGLTDALASSDPAWEVERYTLPARKWKWRMRGSAIVLAQRAREAWLSLIHI